MNLPENNHRQIVQQDLGRLHASEVELLWLIRTKYRFGEIQVVTRDGLPAQILKTIERQALGAGVYPQQAIAESL